ncbi:MAG: MFS transporter [Methanospirillum sp.]|uniref:MFS transporter n=1 Tax=Methanospirillum sp. TaxID=45200 RepID=UPI0023712A15|nr:MFS transporter [Methanospirillum sp.]MDD1730252.1 MFS transporter [Methanospirillum sp.]
MTVISIDHQTRSRIFFSLYSAVFATMIGVGIVIPLLPRYVATLGATGLWIGAIFSAFSLSRALFLPVFGKLSDNHGRRRLILVGLCIYSLISALYTVAGSVLEITALRFLHGIASAMVLPVAIAYISDIAPVGKEGRFVGSFASAISLGMGLGPFIGGTISDLFTMNAVFHSMTLMSFLALITALLFLPDIAPRQVQKYPLRNVITHKPLHGPVLYQLMYALANGTFMVFLPILAIRDGELSASETGIVILVSVLSTPVFQHFFGRIADQFDRYHLIAAGTAMIGVSLFILPCLSGLAPYLAGALLMGIGRGISLPAMYALVTVVGRDIGQGSASSLVNTALSVGLIVSPLVSGVIMDMSGIHTVFFIASVVSAGCTLVFFTMHNNTDSTPW